MRAEQQRAADATASDARGVVAADGPGRRDSARQQR